MTTSQKKPLRATFVALLLIVSCLLLTSCGSTGGGEETDKPAAADIVVVEYRGAKLYCIRDFIAGNSRNTSCDWIRFYDENPGLLTSSTTLPPAGN